MPPRYCAPPDVIRMLQKDGIGWGHDLQCGSFHAPRVARPSLLRKLKTKWS